MVDPILTTKKHVFEVSKKKKIELKIGWQVEGNSSAYSKSQHFRESLISLYQYMPMLLSVFFFKSFHCLNHFSNTTLWFLLDRVSLKNCEKCQTTGCRKTGVGTLHMSAKKHKLQRHFLLE